MAYVFWTNDYSVGNDEIDSQHEHILSLVNALSTAAESGEGAGQADLLLVHLSRCLERHFRAEERLMHLAGFPDLNVHREQHVSCCRHLKALQDLLDSGEIKALDCVAFIEGWLHEHLLGSDQQYAAWFQRNREASATWCRAELHDGEWILAATPNARGNQPA